MLAGRRIVLIEDDEIMGGSITQRLELEGAEVLWLKQAVRALHAIRTPRAPIDAVICDIRLPDGTGEEVFTTLSRRMTPPPFLFITGQGQIEQAVRLMHAGAADYVTKPFDIGVFLERLGLLIRPRDAVKMPPIIGISPAARRIESLAVKAAAADDPVLIMGPSGSGKDLLARRIHATSERRAAPFVEVNLARDPDPAAALFGANGALSRAGEGVLFLHAVERLSPPNQSRLFDALDDKFEGLIVTASRPELEAAVAEGEFRADLHARLCAIQIPIPPLRDRPQDAVWLMKELFPALNERREVPLRGISALAEDAARAHDWPDNGREVRSRLIRGMALAQGEWLFPADLFPEWQAENAFRSLADARDVAERNHILAALDRTGGQIGEAARLLRVSRTTLWEKMQRLGL
jgi:DNA-binding NtrC family response regulator